MRTESDGKIFEQIWQSDSIGIKVGILNYPEKDLWIIDSLSGDWIYCRMEGNDKALILKRLIEPI